MITDKTIPAGLSSLAEGIKTPKLIGETYMKYPTERSRDKIRYGLYECQYCGKEFEAITRDIKKGHTKSCGCQKGGITHGMSSHRFYSTWNHMVGRCTNPKNEDYKNYGGRGITICDEWLDSKKFIAWAEATHPDIEGVSLDRIDNDLGYSPENCRWADKTAQVLNRRIMKNNISGYVGVTWVKNKGKWGARVQIFKRVEHIGYYLSKEEAVLARDQYIIKNKLPHKLSTQY